MDVSAELRSADESTRLGLANWELSAITVASVVGLGISLYLTAAHYEQVPLACSVSSLIDCGSVTHSAYSEVGATSFPISALGAIWFVLVGTLAVARTSSAAWREAWAALVGQSLLAASGLVYVLYLVYAEIVQLHRICEWCTGVHLITVLVFLLTIVHLQRQAQP